ncbi:MAG: hypothetical protein ACLUDU_04650 [Butyricimonas faecihominis]
MDGCKIATSDTRLKSYLYSSVKHGCLDYLKHLQVIDGNKKS